MFHHVIKIYTDIINFLEIDMVEKYYALKYLRRATSLEFDASYSGGKNWLLNIFIGNKHILKYMQFNFTCRGMF